LARCEEGSPERSERLAIGCLRSRMRVPW
jgi:hypothetical protein